MAGVDPRVVTFANQKGGVGKTTTVACLGAALAERGRRVLLVDLDPQACLTFSVGLDPDDIEPSMYEVMLGQVDPRAAIVSTEEGPDLLPASIELAGCEARLLPVQDREYRLRQALTRIAGQRQPYDVVLVDCPPTLGMLTINGLTAADELVIPLQCETLAYRGVGQLLDTVTIDVVGITNPGLKVLGVLPTLYDGRTAHSREVLADITDRYGVAVLSPPIPRTIRFAEAPAAGRTLLSTDSSGKGARAYRELASALFLDR
ncbi:ParA family protein [Fodinicola acaciae]|uniref:ParA family protein n=1 Tax=Fodinicola acaciae TaxID=2681555 RepID=UPI0013D27CDA|nr:AAA family ATPase [Fodinicola acaciae]